MQNATIPARRAGTLGTARPRIPYKAKRWSHQDELSALKGKRIALIMLDGSDPQVGTLLEADQFTVKITAVASDGPTELTMFKHSFAGYRPV